MEGKKKKKRQLSKNWLGDLGAEIVFKSVGVTFKSSESSDIFEIVMQNSHLERRGGGSAKQVV